MFQAKASPNTPAVPAEGAEPISPQIMAMLEPFFRGWRGDASEVALPPQRGRPAPAAARQLVAA